MKMTPLPMPNLDAARAALPLKGRKILIIVENLPLPFDRRVWPGLAGL